MTVTKLSIVFAPCVLRVAEDSPDADLQSMVSDIPLAVAAMKLLIGQHTIFFPAPSKPSKSNSNDLTTESTASNVSEEQKSLPDSSSPGKRMGHLLVAANKSGELEKAVQKMEEETKPAAVAAESVSAPVEGVAGSLYASDTKEFQPYSGFVEKRNKFGMWQKRFFELCTHYLSYYKTADKEKVLGTIDLCAVRCGRL